MFLKILGNRPLLPQYFPQCLNVAQVFAVINQGKPAARFAFCNNSRLHTAFWQKLDRYNVIPGSPVVVYLKPKQTGIFILVYDFPLPGCQSVFECFKKGEGRLGDLRFECLPHPVIRICRCGNSSYEQDVYTYHYERCNCCHRQTVDKYIIDVGPCLPVDVGWGKYPR